MASVHYQILAEYPEVACTFFTQPPTTRPYFAPRTESSPCPRAKGANRVWATFEQGQAAGLTGSQGYPGQLWSQSAPDLAGEMPRREDANSCQAQ